MCYYITIGAGGKDGVKTALDIIHKELDVTMALCGYNDITKVDERILTRIPFTNR